MPRIRFQQLLAQYHNNQDDLDDEIANLEAQGDKAGAEELMHIRDFLLQREEAEARNPLDIPSPRPDSELSLMPDQHFIRYTPQGAMSYPTNIPLPQSWGDDVDLLLRLGYEIKQQIGEGGYGNVFACEFTDKNGQKHALACKRGVLRIKRHLKLFEREKEVLMRCNHENIVQVQNIINLHHIGPEFPDRILMFMPMANSDLSKVHEQQVLIPLPVIKDYFEQILNGLKYLHDLGIAHRDIKPENVLVFRDHASNRYNLKLGDFGMVHLFDPASRPRSNSWPGTPGYEAPEMWRQIPDYNPLLSDVWSTGIMFALLLSNFNNRRRLFDIAKDQNNVSNMAGSLLVRIVANRRPAAIANLIQSMLQEDPPQRCDVDDALGAVLAWSI